MLKPDYPVRTPRLVLRPFTPDDLDALHDFHRLPEVTRYLYHEPRNRAEVSVLLQGKIAASVLPADGKALCLAAELAETGQLAGDCTLFWLSQAHQQGEIGFIFHPAFQGRGLATEAAGGPAPARVRGPWPAPDHRPVRRPQPGVGRGHGAQRHAP